MYGPLRTAVASLSQDQSPIQLWHVGGVIAKDLCSYTTIILRPNKKLRDHGRTGVYAVIRVHIDARDMCA
jgi:hypothetical protein